MKPLSRAEFKKRLLADKPGTASIGKLIGKAGMAELADAADSKSAEGNLVGVQPPLPAPSGFSLSHFLLVAYVRVECGAE